MPSRYPGRHSIGLVTMGVPVVQGRPSSTTNHVHVAYLPALFLLFRLPMSQPHDRSFLTTLGVMAAVSGTRTKMKVLWMA